MGPEHHDEAARWDRFYTGGGDQPRHWSGRPNPTLVTEVAALRAGRALDVGCGEGADATWLAARGWQVTGIDPSEVALRRAETVARAAGVAVTWVRAGLVDLPEGHGPYDLVAAHYPVVPRGDDDEAVAALLRAVAVGGTLLVVHHELDPAHAADHGFDLDVHLTPDTVAARLDDSWHVEVAATRDRDAGATSADGHPRDVVLRARRR
jgi:SAM-dependent methyltransferase